MFLRSQPVVTMHSAKHMNFIVLSGKKHNDLVTITRSLMCWIEVTMTRMSTALLEQPDHAKKLEMKVFQMQRRSLESMSEKMKATILTSRCLAGHRNCTGLLKRVASRSRVSSPAWVHGRCVKTMEIDQLTEDTHHEEC